MIKKETKEKRTHNGLEVDSDEEYYFLLWVEELMQVGLIDKVERAESFILSESCVNNYTETVVLKSKTKEVAKHQKLLEGCVYTPDFTVTFTDKGKELFLNCINKEKDTKKFIKIFIGTGNIAFFEVKPAFDANNMTRLFKIHQKWLFAQYEIFANLVQPLELFEKTFTPAYYLQTPTGKRRTIHWEIRELQTYLKTFGI